MHFRCGRWVLFLLVVTSGLSSLPAAVAESGDWYQRQTKWNGYDQFHFSVAGRPAYLVAPKQAADGKPWVWRARFPGFHAEMDIKLLAQGWHVGYVDVASTFGSPRAVKIGDAFYKYVTDERGLSPQVALEGVSRGGLFVYNWAAKNPAKVASIYCDTPVCDIRSWPGGKGGGRGTAREWRECLAEFGLTEEAAGDFTGHPIDHAPVIAAAKIPVLHIVSENDQIVPPKENTYVLQARMAEQRWAMEVISVAEGTQQSSGHHFDHPAVERVVEFFLAHQPQQQELRRRLLQRPEPSRPARLVFLGDSITYGGGYVAMFDAWLQTERLPHPPVVINVGLPSETVSGLSEAGHAGGRFPRPDLKERLQRVLDATSPDVVLACYGINCGIQQPFSEERFERYQQGVKNLRAKVAAAGAKLVHITPPTFDKRAGDATNDYDAVMDRYSRWLLSQRKQGWLVIDLHQAMAEELARRRAADARFTFQPDSVHPNQAGHWVMAQQLIRWFGDHQAAQAESPTAMLAQAGLPAELLPLVRSRAAVLRDAYLSVAGHKRPGIRAGLPLADATRQAEQITSNIEAATAETTNISAD